MLIFFYKLLEIKFSFFLSFFNDKAPKTSSSENVKGQGSSFEVNSDRRDNNMLSYQHFSANSTNIKNVYGY